MQISRDDPLWCRDPFLIRQRTAVEGISEGGGRERDTQATVMNWRWRAAWVVPHTLAASTARESWGTLSSWWKLGCHLPMTTWSPLGLGHGRQSWCHVVTLMRGSTNRGWRNSGIQECILLAQLNGSSNQPSQSDSHRGEIRPQLQVVIAKCYTTDISSTKTLGGRHWPWMFKVGTFSYPKKVYRTKFQLND